MKKLIIIFFGITVTACSSSLTYNQSIEKNEKNLASSAIKSDAKFLVEAKSYSILEQELGKLAMQRAYSAEVQSFGQKIATDHEKMNKDIDDVASNLKIKVPSEMSEAHRYMYEKLEKTDRSSFDRAFVSVIEDIYERNINLMKDFATSASEGKIRAFAAEYLGILRTNENHADQLEGRLL